MNPPPSSPGRDSQHGGMFHDAADRGWGEGGSIRDVVDDSDELDSVFNMESVSRAASRIGKHSPRGHRARPPGVVGSGEDDEDDEDLLAGNKLKTLLTPKKHSLGKVEEKDLPVIDSRAAAEVVLGGMVGAMGAVNDLFKGASGAETQVGGDMMCGTSSRLRAVQRDNRRDTLYP